MTEPTTDPSADQDDAGLSPCGEELAGETTRATSAGAASASEQADCKELAEEEVAAKLGDVA